MKYDGNSTCLNIHSSTRKRLREIKESTGFSSYEELINYLLDRYFEENFEEENEGEHTRDQKEDI